jgi:hypothetical protein
LGLSHGRKPTYPQLSGNPNFALDVSRRRCYLVNTETKGDTKT